jgi:hypothetical protein
MLVEASLNVSSLALQMLWHFLLWLSYAMRTWMWTAVPVNTEKKNLSRHWQRHRVFLCQSLPFQSCSCSSHVYVLSPSHCLLCSTYSQSRHPYVHYCTDLKKQKFQESLCARVRPILLSLFHVPSLLFLCLHSPWIDKTSYPNPYGAPSPECPLCWAKSEVPWHSLATRHWKPTILKYY